MRWNLLSWAMFIQTLASQSNHQEVIKCEAVEREKCFTFTKIEFRNRLEEKERGRENELILVIEPEEKDSKWKENCEWKC